MKLPILKINVFLQWFLVIYESMFVVGLFAC
jgi:hypothetical protein